MKILIAMTIMALSLTMLASKRPIYLDKQAVRQLAGKEVLRQLMQQTPWERGRLAHMLQLEFFDDVAAADYVPNAYGIMGKLVKETVLSEEKLTKLLLWKVVTPRGRQNWLLGTRHDIRLVFFSTTARQDLKALLAEIKVFMHEGDALPNTVYPIERYLQLDYQLIVTARQQGKKIVPLENSFDELSAATALLRVGVKALRDELQLEKRLETLNEEETHAHFLEEVAELERDSRELQAYLRGEYKVLREFEQQFLEELGDTQVDLIDSRNRNWLPKIIASCESRKPCLIAAGYGHLIYDNENITSIITRLQEQGYRVEPALYD